MLLAQLTQHFCVRHGAGGIMAHAFDKARLAVHVGNGRKMPALPSPCVGLLQEAMSFIQLAAHSQHKRKIERRRSTGLLPETKGKSTITVNVAKCDCTFQMRARAVQVACEPAGQAEHTMRANR